MLKPQHVVGPFAVFADARRGLANAERARAAAAVREIDVEPIVDGVDDGFSFLHAGFFRPGGCSRWGGLTEMPAAPSLALCTLCFRF